MYTRIRSSCGMVTHILYITICILPICCFLLCRTAYVGQFGLVPTLHLLPLFLNYIYGRVSHWRPHSCYISFLHTSINILFDWSIVEIAISGFYWFWLERNNKNVYMNIYICYLFYICCYFSILAYDSQPPVWINQESILLGSEKLVTYWNDTRLFLLSFKKKLIALNRTDRAISYMHNQMTEVDYRSALIMYICMYICSVACASGRLVLSIFFMKRSNKNYNGMIIDHIIFTIWADRLILFFAAAAAAGSDHL